MTPSRRLLAPPGPNLLACCSTNANTFGTNINVDSGAGNANKTLVVPYMGRRNRAGYLIVAVQKKKKR
ncbi:hypothetical protein DAPPUDRAFT_256488 [Daphnia pulex]|uniref:Uncharacterized protein n=1 Tax=Daphnia pulex TaxID=6669 RepID=E9HBG7_DAPPU|nr:hypothetical protein DAPPUDRAFT_256488 [Daphnia pulex]|eukprot:EFX70839.1 hypothetical protein DAPPUDRAFT_256488 [Daphnia pulex]